MIKQTSNIKSQILDDPFEVGMYTLRKTMIIILLKMADGCHFLSRSEVR